MAECDSILVILTLCRLKSSLRVYVRVKLPPELTAIAEVAEKEIIALKTQDCVLSPVSSRQQHVVDFMGQKAVRAFSAPDAFADGG